MPCEVSIGSPSVLLGIFVVVIPLRFPSVEADPVKRWGCGRRRAGALHGQVCRRQRGRIAAIRLRQAVNESYEGAMDAIPSRQAATPDATEAVKSRRREIPQPELEEASERAERSRLALDREWGGLGKSVGGVGERESQEEDGGGRRFKKTAVVLTAACDWIRAGTVYSRGAQQEEQGIVGG